MVSEFVHDNANSRTVITDFWFASPKMMRMLSDLGLYSIVQYSKFAFGQKIDCQST